MQNEIFSLGLRSQKAKRIFYGVGLFFLLLATLLTFPSFFGFHETFPLASPSPEGGFLYKSPLPKMKNVRSQHLLLPSDHPQILENGIPLKRLAAHKDKIKESGWGRYRVIGNEIFFSTSDGQPLGDRVYSLRYSQFFPYEGVLLLFWLLGCIAFCAGRFLSVQENPNVPWDAGLQKTLLLLLPAGWWTAFFLFPTEVSTGFFSGVFLSSIWALSIAIVAWTPLRLASLSLAILALVPAAAGYFYSSVLGAPNDFFVVGGTFPWSDATQHFQQAVEIARTGTTEIGFNGRFLYPLFFAGIWQLCGENIQLVHFVSSTLILLLFAAVCRISAGWLRIAGTTFFSLVCWLYIGGEGVSLVTTENLGFALGMIGTGLFLAGIDAKKSLLVLLGLLAFSLGMSSRPGALFLLPTLTLFFAWKFGWNHHSVITRKISTRIRSAGIAFALACIVVLAGFSANHPVLRQVYPSGNPAFQNFAFSLHGLLTGTNWSVSYHAYDKNAQAVMEESLRLLRERPTRLVEGIQRAAAEIYPRCFFFRFKGEKHFAFLGSLLAAIGIIGILLIPSLRRHALWVLFGLVGILASVPFAPPWDAGIRPYAVTMPVTALLAGIGSTFLAIAIQKLGAIVASTFLPSPHLTNSLPFWKKQFLKIRQILTTPPHATPAPCRLATPALLVLSAILLFFIVLPLFVSVPPSPSKETSWDFLPGGCLLVTEAPLARTENFPPDFRIVSRSTFLDFFSRFRGSHPEIHDFIATRPGDFLLGISRDNLHLYCLPWPLPATTPKENPGGFHAVGQFWAPNP